MVPVLRVLLDNEVHSVKDIREAAANLLSLTPSQREETIPSGMLRYQNRCNWAISYLKHASAISAVSRGQYRITDAGRSLLSAHPDELLEHDLDEVPGYDSESSWGSSTRQAVIVTHDETLEVDDLSPTEQMEQGLSRTRAEVSSDLLARLRASDPSFFERAVVDVLLAMGYGGAEGRGTVVGGTGDGGIDGVIDQDALGLDQIYVQAKRYSEGNNVGRETLQAFVGALQWRNVNRGVFITSSDFTKGAVDFANSVSTRIILVNGRRLTELMIRYKVGVQVEKTYELPKVDEDFFEG